MEQPDVVCLNVSIAVPVIEREFSAVLREQRRSENQEITGKDLKERHENYSASDGYWDMWAKLVNQKKASFSVIPIDLLRFFEVKTPPSFDPLREHIQEIAAKTAKYAKDQMNVF
ncbi:hypothetical protein GEMRC1_006993 [Eukaryota sp. GEM-RC1]